MERYIGLDVHRESTTCAVMDAGGKKLRLEVVRTSSEELTGLIDAIEGTRFIAFEEGTQSEWLYEILSPLAEDTVCVMPKRREGPKSDARDAWQLAERLRRGTLERHIYKETGPYASLRARVRAHRWLTQDAVRCKNRLRAVYRGRGIQCSSTDIYRSDRRESWLAKLPPASRSLAEILGAQLDELVALRDQAAEALLEEASHHGVIDRLSTIPGIGARRAAYIVAIVVTPHRFRSKRQFWAYCGLAVVTRSSADWVREGNQWVRSRKRTTRGLNRNGNPVLKDIFKGAALSVAQMKDGQPLKADYEQLLHTGLKPKIARLTIARRLAATTLSLWKNQEVYNPAKRYRPPRPA